MIKILGLWNTLYCISIILFAIFILLFLYNIFHLIYWWYKEHYDRTNTHYETKKIYHFKNKSLIYLIILIPLTSIFLLYNLPRSFDEIISLNEQNNLSKIYVYGYFLNKDAKQLAISKDMAQDILKLFKGYKYRRHIDDGSSKGNKKVLLHLITTSSRWSIHIEVWDAGYIRVLNNELYEIIDATKKDLLDKIIETYSFHL